MAFSGFAPFTPPSPSPSPSPSLRKEALNRVTLLCVCFTSAAGVRLAFDTSDSFQTRVIQSGKLQVNDFEAQSEQAFFWSCVTQRCRLALILLRITLHHELRCSARFDSIVPDPQPCVHLDEGQDYDSQTEVDDGWDSKGHFSRSKRLSYPP